MLFARRANLVASLMLATFAAVLALSPTVRTQAAPDIAVVANKGVAIDNLPVTELRRILLGDREFWQAGPRVLIYLRAPVARERDAAVKTVCDMTEAQFRQHWIGKVFRAESQGGPKIVYSADAALEQVAKNAGAIAFVEASAVTKDVKVIKVDGLMPGQAGYKLK